MAAHLVLGKGRHCELEASLTYRVRPGHPGLHRETLSQKGRERL